MSKENRRLFTAIAFDDKRKGVIERNVLKAAESGRMRPVRRENFHLTLVYIGNSKRAEAAVKALKQVRSEAFVLEFTQGSYFKKRNALILWQGVKRCPELLALQSKVKAALEAAGFPCDERPYRPHVTLARNYRKNKETDLSAVLEHFEKPADMKVFSLSLFESKRENGVLVYEELERFPFAQ